MQAQTWKKEKKNTQGAAFLISSHRSKFEKAISRVICQATVFMQLKAGWELDEWNGMLMFLVQFGPEVLACANLKCAVWWISNFAFCDVLEG